ncbi:MAG: hypothetical protein P4L53_04875, partial [Candidatus Obscuribacterales bacterium]|nr:hypothetical protein [Candidatus Obscuribacterales bacterium]
VQINLNQFGITGTNTFLLGGGGSNGTGLIDATPVSGNYGEIYITNGAGNSGVGNMTISSANAVKIPDGGGSAGGGYLALEAYGGTLTLPIGSISVPGAEAAIQLAAKEVDTVDGTNLSANYTAGGDYHYVDIYADTFKYTGNVAISANGSGSASNNAASVYMQGYTTTSPTQVNIVGTTGATLNMGADGDHTYAQVDADAVTFTNGSVTMHAKGTTDNQVLLNSPSFTNTADILTLNSASVTLDASGMSGGNGGVVQVSSNQILAATPSRFILHADGDTNGAGGSITVNSSADFDASNMTITADGAGTGNGGLVNLQNPTGGSDGEFDPDSIVSVDAGNDLNGCCTAAAKSGQNISPLDAASNDGKIKVSRGTSETSGGVTCQQYLLQGAPWPESFWDCTGKVPPALPTFYQSQAALMLPSTLTSKMGTVYLHTFNTRTDEQNYFHISKPTSADAVGFTHVYDDRPTWAFSSVFEQDFTLKLPEQEVSIHEMGHGFDDVIANGDPTQRPSVSAQFTGYALNDWFALDYITNADGTHTPRDPCFTTIVGQKAPLQNVYDSYKGAQYCNSNGTLVNPTAYAKLTNSAILQLAEPHIFAPNEDGDPYTELFAQEFAYISFSATTAAAYNANPVIPNLANMSDATADTFFANPYDMQCTTGYMIAIYSGNAAKIPSYCAGTVPTNWYAPYGQIMTNH